MEEIKNYLSIIEAHLLQHISGKPRDLIKLIDNLKNKSEEDIIRIICEDKHSKTYYANIKSRTLKILQALTIVSTSQGANEVKKKLDLCRKKFIIAQKFLGRGERPEGIRLAKQAYRIALEYEFLHMACELSSILYHDHIYYHPNPAKAAYYESQTEEHLKAYLIEKRTEHLFYKVIAHLDKSFTSKQFEDIIKEVEISKGKSLSYHTHRAMIKVLYGFNIGNYSLIIKNCCWVLDYFEGKKGVYSSHWLFFLMNMGIAQMAIADYANANQNFVKAEQYALSKSVNDYLLRLYRTINMMHQGDYKKAYDLYRQNRKCRFEMIRQQFAIIEAYMCFLAHRGYLQLETTFRLGKYLNETFKAQADKRGSNIAILIAELLVYLSRDRGKFIDRVEAINNYTYRHLKGPGTKRAKQFIKILCLMPRANFDPAALQRIAHKQIQFLEEHPVYMGDHVLIEIIPFGSLLEMIMEQLKQKVA